jgi:hypothetical protein
MSTPTRVRQRRAVNAKEGHVIKSVEHKMQGKLIDEADTNETFVGTDEANPAYVGVSGSTTKNLGNYESLKVSVSVNLPCAPTAPAVRKTFDAASEMVAEFIKLEIDNALGVQG